jgi:hypothetical protein
MLFDESFTFENLKKKTIKNTLADYSSKHIGEVKKTYRMRFRCYEQRTILPNFISQFHQEAE